MSTSLIDFLLARIAEDESFVQRIIAATYCDHNAEWRCDSSAVLSIGDEKLDSLIPTCCAVVGDFAARFDPARILAECAAKRAVVELHEGEIQIIHTGASAMSGDPLAHGLVIKSEGRVILEALATVYSSHPEYQSDWAVTA
ncbi:hypothetical protein SAMN04489743_2825 [Pseudarthrobacter equi]|uniref:Uncharacterized protein n=1 Tax=Pseudarthrobacter equi TaxID=728066 RepID=A0A1H2A744_9MICC|nr:DUF6221 family protein [Pseudarthrobacter equi]SDT41790.1 hypothetical protein SAMN04489743_2825 [Pseudarthrobacter equi]